MAVDLSVDMIKATVQLEQPLGNGERTVGTGFLVNAPAADGQPRTILITAAHVLHKMPSGEARIGYRFQAADGSWRYAPQPLVIRTGQGAPKWVQHPSRDVAALEIAAPPEFAQAAIPLTWLANDETFNSHGLAPGDEMMALGFPLGLSANQAGFPILRAGKVASYPLAPSAEFPTFLLDFNVFPGNSGGPIYVGKGDGFVAGILTQQVELSGDRLDIGIVTHARYVRETVEMIDGKSPPGMSFATAPTPGARAASASGQGR